VIPSTKIQDMLYPKIHLLALGRVSTTGCFSIAGQ
jgi:hypothetical protein